MSDLKKLIRKLSFRLKVDEEEVEKFLVYLLCNLFIDTERENQKELFDQAKQNKYICSLSPNPSLHTSSSVLSTLVDNTNNNISNKESVLSESTRPASRVKRVKISKADKIRYQTVVIPSYTKTKKELIKPTKDILSVIEFWNALGLRKCNEGTKIWERSIQNIRKARLGWIPISDKKYSYEEMKESIKKFSLSALDPNYFPINGTPHQKRLQGKALDVFIWDDFSKKSPFIDFLSKELKLVHSHPLHLEEDKDPKVTQRIKSIYIQKILGGVEPPNGFPPHEDIKFITASNKLTEFYQKNKDYMNLEMFGIFSVEDFTDILWECIEKDNSITYDITPGFLCSDFTFSKRLPTYLYKEGIIEDRRDLF